VGRRFLVTAILGVLALACLSTASARTPQDVFVYPNDGKPDLVVDQKRMANSVGIVDRTFEKGSCDLDEGSVGAAGTRRLMRFDIVIRNTGDGDLLVGNRADPNNPYADWFEFAPCHGHYHIRDFSKYELLKADGSVAASGHKQGFCFADSFRYDGANPGTYPESCDYQGISSGWGDFYYKQLPGQWVDITGVSAGTYTLRVTINLAGTFDEGENRYADIAETTVQVPDPDSPLRG
jgi:hypothetical protein